VVKLFLVAALLRYVVTVAEKLNTYENVVSFIPQIWHTPFKHQRRAKPQTNETEV
jgi:hypothetical protein